MAENEEIKNETAVSETPETTETENTAAENTDTEETVTEEKPEQETEREIVTEDVPAAENKPAKKKSGSKNPFRNKKFKHGALSIVFSLIFIAAVVLVNVILRLVADRFSLEKDLTTGELFSLGEDTKAYIPTVEDDIHFYFTNERTALVDSGTFGKQVVEFAERMVALNNRFDVKYVNLLTDPDFSNNYVETLQNGQIIVQSGTTNRYRVLTMNDFLSFTLSDGNTYTYNDAYMINMYMQYYGYTLVSQDSSAEEQLVSAIMSVSKQDPTVVTFLTGYGESDSSALEKILTDNAYLVNKSEIDRIEAISEDTDILVMHGPTLDYSLDAITKVDEWLSNNGKYGKSLVYLATPEAANTPNLDEYLKEWGLEIGKGYVLQSDENYARTYMGYRGVMQDLEIVTDTDYYNNMKIQQRASLIGFYLRPVIKLYEEESNKANKTIVRCYGDKCLFNPFKPEEGWDPTEDDLSSYDIIVESSKVQFEGGTEPVYSKIIAVGSDLLFDQNFTSASNYSNGEVALTLFDTNSDSVNQEIKIVKKSFTQQTYQISESQQKWIGLTFAVFIPIAIIVLGIVVWVRRRRL